MITTLLEEADVLSERLSDLMFEASYAGKPEQVERINRVIEKALNRYKRRYQKWQAELQDSQNGSKQL